MSITGYLVCGEGSVDPAQMGRVRSAAATKPDCVVPLCHQHHRRYARGQLDLLPYLEPRLRTELQHGLGHLGLLGLLRRVTGTRWTPAGERSGEGRRSE
jgi:hypothetical protein